MGEKNIPDREMPGRISDFKTLNEEWNKLNPVDSDADEEQADIDNAKTFGRNSNAGDSQTKRSGWYSTAPAPAGAINDNTAVSLDANPENVRRVSEPTPNAGQQQTTDYYAASMGHKSGTLRNNKNQQNSDSVSNDSSNDAPGDIGKGSTHRNTASEEDTIRNQ